MVRMIPLGACPMTSLHYRVGAAGAFPHKTKDMRQRYQPPSFIVHAVRVRCSYPPRRQAPELRVAPRQVGQFDPSTSPQKFNRR
ncbi:hypothetical protein SAMN05446635_4847 [Burkholderia sp. OK233]|nr:hypothetical protein SAMN05446635_4847 [Burkholderia sp. OK233]